MPPRSALKAFDQQFGSDEVTLPDITTFARTWAGINLTMFQRVVLKLFEGEPLSEIKEPTYDFRSEQDLFDEMYDAREIPSDAYKRVSAREGMGFKNLLLVIGRRGGKSTIVAVAVCYTAAKLLQHHNPQASYGMQENDTIQIAVAATSSAQSERSPFKKIESIFRWAIVNNSPLGRYLDDDGLKTGAIYLLTEHDREVKKAMKRRRMDRRASTVHIYAYHSNSDTLRGGAVIAAIFDEFAQFKVTVKGQDSAALFFDALAPSLTQFGDDSRVFILSSPQGEVGKFYDMHMDIWSGLLPSTFGIQMSTWRVWEWEPESPRKQTLLSLARDDMIAFSWDPMKETAEEALRKAPSSFLMEFGAIFMGAEDQWIPSILINNPEPDKGIFRANLQHITQGVIGRLYAVHCDPATREDAFAIGVVHKEHTEDGDIIVVDHLVRFYVAPSVRYTKQEYEFVYRQVGPEPAVIRFREVEDYLKNYILGRFNVAYMSFDQMQSHQMIENLSLYVYDKGMNTIIEELKPNQSRNTEWANHFERLFLEHRLGAYHHPVFEGELKGLRKDRYGKVEKGPGKTDDLWDCVKVAAYNAITLPAEVDEGFMGRQYSVEPSFPQARI